MFAPPAAAPSVNASHLQSHANPLHCALVGLLARPKTPQPLQSTPSFLHTRTDSAASLTSLAGSLLFEFEEDEHELCPPMVARLPSDLKRWSDLPADSPEAQLWMHAMEAKMHVEAHSSSSSSSLDSSVDIKAFAQRLADQGHATFLRNGTYTPPPEAGIPITCRNSFCLVSLPGPTYCIVDPNYKEQFKISGRDAQAYTQVLELLPDIFVGGAERLAQLVHVMCKEMEKVFSARGVPLPPWRTPRVMQGRWLVNQAQDIQVLPSHTASSPVSRTASAELN